MDKATKIIAIVVACVVFMLVMSPLTVLLVFVSIIAVEANFVNSFQPSPTAIQLTSVPVQFNPPPNSTSQSGNQPYIICTSLTAQDERTEQASSLYIRAQLDNTGGGTAYNMFLHVQAYNKEGLAIDNYYSLGGLTPHATMGVGFSLNYSGGPIENCSVTPTYTNMLTPAFNSTVQ